MRDNLITAQYLQADYSPIAGMLGSRTSLVAERRLRDRADALAGALGLGDLLDTQVAGLPYGTLKRVEIATVLATDPDVLLLDEPSSGMGPEEAHRLGDTLLELRQDFGLSIAMIEHHVPLVVRICDYVYCLDFGELLVEGSAEHVRNDRQVVAAYLGEDPDPAVLALEHQLESLVETRLMALLEVEDCEVGYGFPVLMGISFEVEEGETAVLFGLNGAGKTTTVATIAGHAQARRRLDPLRRRGDRRPLADPARRPRASRSSPRAGGCSPASAWPTTCGSVPGRSAAIETSSRSAASSSSSTSPASPSARSRPPGTLSGGEQQMLAIGRAIMSKPKLLLIDEASLGLSPALAKVVFEVVKRINEDGVTVVIVEQNVGVLPYADRALIMEKGTLIFSGVGDEIRSANLRETYLGGADE